jgi:alkylation response protein AidB-like acyl-CoA dehydrogenase
MDFDLSADQQALREAARELLAAAASMDRVRAVMGAPEGHDPVLWKQIAEQGWLALEVAAADGGLGLSFVETAVLAEEIGRHVAPAPFLSTALALAAFRDAGDAGPLADWRAGMAEGALVGAVAWGGHPVVDLPIADVLVVVDHAGAGVRALEVGGRRPPAEPAMDATRTLAWLGELAVADAVAVGGGELAEAMLDRGAAAFAAELLGAADRALVMATEYAKVREQFGRPIGSFQAVKHRLADMLVDVEGMRSAAYYAAWAVATDAPDRSLAASTAKSWCADASRRVMASALQVHGGIGFTWEHDLHLYLKRAHTDETQFGSAAAHRERLARLLRARIEAGADLW